jgi:hypothetical protein
LKITHGDYCSWTVEEILLGKTTNKLRIIEKLLFDAYRQLITIGVEGYNQRITVGEVPFDQY